MCCLVKAFVVPLGFEAFHPSPKDTNAVESKLFEASCGVVYRPFTFGVTFRVKLISIANHLLFECTRTIVARGERQFLGGAYNPQLGAAISLVMMVIVLVCMIVMNRFGEGEEQAVML